MILPRLKGAAGPSPDSEEYDEEPDVELIPIPATQKVMWPHFWGFLVFSLAFKVPGSSSHTTRIHRRSEHFEHRVLFASALCIGTNMNDRRHLIAIWSSFMITTWRKFLEFLALKILWVEV
jgi:hypothetical protein